MSEKVRKQQKFKEPMAIEQGGFCSVCKNPLVNINEHIKSAEKKHITISIDSIAAHIRAFKKNASRFDEDYGDTEKKENMTLDHASCHKEKDLKENEELYSVEDIEKQKRDVIDKTSDKNVYIYLSSCPLPQKK